ncbi:hypothetical protein [Pseudoalteromonas luteoviolacea]|uniref:ABM domain-containing protein n=1 Tax=Pseudoalteromonas luteoviolacea S4060-1 TaxID=1365257 RepID=A0A161YX48_9GAMM|nr:hypothetical protein [Pseudoalteromonas luteoviolacea]KZN67476.1 hypothetical protein N478_01630 [Pseudoalteromonas luteoviolacea S4060-1]
MPVRVQIACSLKPSNYLALKAFLEENLPNVRGFEGCERVNILFDETQSQMLIDEDWQSINTHQNYMMFISNNGVLETLKAYFSEPPKISYFYLSNL